MYAPRPLSVDILAAQVAHRVGLAPALRSRMLGGDSGPAALRYARGCLYLALWHSGRSWSQVAASVGASPSYVRQAVVEAQRDRRRLPLLRACVALGVTPARSA